MRVVSRVIGTIWVGAAVLAVALSGWSLRAQTTTDATKPSAEAVPAKTAEPTRPRPDYITLPLRTFYLKNAAQPNDGNEIQTAIRNMLPPDTRIYFVPSESALLVRGTPDQFSAVQKILDDLDRPRKSYRLIYTITEMEGNKRVTTQHFTLMPADGQRVVLKQGIKVPIATGSYSATSNSAGAQTQFTYLDVGMNFDATLAGIAGGGLLKTKVEQTSLAEDRTISGVTEPVIRQTSLEGTSLLVTGKPLMLGSLDVPGGTRHLDVEVTMEEIR